MNQSKEQLNLSLENVLEDLIKVYRNLLETVRNEKEILIGSNLDELTENNRAKEAMLVRIRSLEETRIQVAADLCEALGLSRENPRLLDIARHLGGVEGDRMHNMHSVLELLLKRVQELNKQNEGLVESALSHITGAMKAIRETLKEKPTYQRKGEVAAAPAQSGQLVSREA